MQALLWPLISWVFRKVVIQFIVLASVIACVVFLVPYAIGYLTGFTGTSGLSGAFAGLPPGVWYFLDMFRLDYGVPLCISAFVSRFLIRRLPFIG